MDDHSRAALVADIKQQLKSEMGLMPVSMLRERRQSFVELYSYDATGASNYGTAGYLGHGYFITVKHGVVALGDKPESRRITSIKIMYNGRADAREGRRHRRRPGRSRSRRLGDPEGQGTVDLPAARGQHRLRLRFRRSDLPPRQRLLEGDHPLDRLRRAADPNNLVTCLTDGHPGVSGGGVLNGDGQLVGIPIGRMQGDYRFSFILPLRGEMFRKVAFLN